jgi:thiol-disulfide isomerase/thioredoxin
MALCNICAFCLFIGASFFVATSSAAFTCEDRSEDCPAWKQNMAGNCRGDDYLYMRYHCAVTCDLCEDAEKAWQEEQEELQKNPTVEPDDSKVIVLDAEGEHGVPIDDFVESECVEDICLVEFFAPWCGSCKEVAPSYREAARELNEALVAGSLPVAVKLAKFDDSAEYNQGYRAADANKWNFTSYPSLFIVGGAKYGTARRFNKVRYAGGKEEAAEVVFHMTSLSSGMDQKAAWEAYHDVEKRNKPGFYKEGGKHHSTQITELDPDNFQDTVLRSDAMWVVEYYSDKCPICGTLAPEIIKAAEKVQNEFPTKIRFGAINSRVFDELADPFGVTSYPWITSFYLGKKVEDMAGLGGWESVYDFAKAKAQLWKSDGVADSQAVIPKVEKKPDKEDL